MQGLGVHRLRQVIVETRLLRQAAVLLIDEKILNRLAQERTRLLEEAREKTRESMALEMQDLMEALTEARTKLGEAQQLALQLRKERRELEAQKQELELAVNRRLDEGRSKIRQETKKEAQEENRLREADQEKLIADLREQIGVLKRKSEQGSQQAQGEVLKLEIEDLLQHHFPSDIIEDIPRGTHGGDVLQHVRNNLGRDCGTILWESERTKAWSDVWVGFVPGVGLALFGRAGGGVLSGKIVVGRASAAQAGTYSPIRRRASKSG